MRYLFSDKDCDYYECNYEFYKVRKGETIKVNIEDDEALSNYYN